MRTVTRASFVPSLLSSVFQATLRGFNRDCLIGMVRSAPSARPPDRVLHRSFAGAGLLLYGDSSAFGADQKNSHVTAPPECCWRLRRRFRTVSIPRSCVGVLRSH